MGYHSTTAKPSRCVRDVGRPLWDTTPAPVSAPLSLSASRGLICADTALWFDRAEALLLEAESASGSAGAHVR